MGNNHIIHTNESVEMAIADQTRIIEGKKEMDAVMQKYGIKLDIGMIIRPGRVEPLVRIVLDPAYVPFPPDRKGD